MTPVTRAAAFSIAVLLALAASARPRAGDAESEVRALLGAARPYTPVPAPLFEQLGWDLPDGGATVKGLAERAPGSAFDPRDLQKANPKALGYRATWHEIRFGYYGLEWDITGLLLTPTAALPRLPTIAFVNGGSANWYEFFVDPLNGPAVGQFLAQRVPVLLVTIPGNYRPGGWTAPIPERRPAYLLDRELSAGETAARNAMMTFSVVAEGVARLIESATSGPVVIAGHSTGGELQFLLRDRLRTRLQGRSLGWGTGGPASIRRTWNDEAAGDRNRENRRREYPPLAVLRPRTAEEYARSYVGPLNPLGVAPGSTRNQAGIRPGSDSGLTPLDIAKRWFAREDRRRPQFKQVLQDLEHQGSTERREAVAREIREAIAAARLSSDPETVIADLFSTTRAPLDGYHRMVWTTAAGDDGHWDPDPERARELFVARAFQRANPDAEIRVLVFDVPMSHYGHIERPRQLAGGILAAVKWLYRTR